MGPLKRQRQKEQISCYLKALPPSVAVTLSMFLDVSELAKLEVTCKYMREAVRGSLIAEHLKPFYPSTIPDYVTLFTLEFMKTHRKRTTKVLALGLGHSLALLDGKVFSFGTGSHGALGHGNKLDQEFPKQIERLKNLTVKSVSAGGYHSVVLTEDGRLYTFGEGGFGRLGHGDEAGQDRPKLVKSLVQETICAVTAGCNHCVAVNEKGQAYFFGKDVNEKTLSKSWLKPTLIKSLSRSRVVAVAAGMAHSLLLTDRFEVLSFGMGRWGRLGHGNEEDKPQPQLIETLRGKRVVGISAGGNYSLAYTHTGQLYTFGHNGHQGKLGHGEIESKCVTIPTMIQSIWKNHVIVDCAAGTAHTILLTQNGEVLTFGDGRYGKLGHGDEFDQYRPKLVSKFRGVKIRAIGAGDWHSMAQAENGTTYSWGGGWFHRLGHANNRRNETVPREIKALGKNTDNGLRN